MCRNRLITRGLGRVALAEEMKKVLDFLTINGYINFGILECVPMHFNLNYWKVSSVKIFKFRWILSCNEINTVNSCDYTVLLTFFSFRFWFYFKYFAKMHSPVFLWDNWMIQEALNKNLASYFLLFFIKRAFYTLFVFLGFSDCCWWWYCRNRCCKTIK